MSFRLYAEEKAIFPFCDYAALLGAAVGLGARSVLEFGPGLSTLALIEAGCAVESCEHDPAWLQRARDGFAAWPQVRVHGFDNRTAIAVPELDDARFDLAFVDAPVGQGRRRVALPGQEDCNRLNTVLYALDHAPVVLLHDARREGEQATLARLESEGWRVDMIATPKGIARIARA